MVDIVTAATIHGSQNFDTNGNTKWTITFTNNESRKGQVVSLGNGTFMLNGDQRVYYFSAEQVVYMTISDVQA
ncbi:hypothetical protein [Massilia sp. Leaf139]|uniref:hypothetical protein n=1 Tax=Massilia sp. Leaf139 TaxID=1736272 RepID=UPI0007147CB0|nr:hypothetical protein [Massilia sp. Leaf139]KQQ93639.1 hypothetical protein ASF77_22405 [Massilia sp. Leaf139]